MGRGAADMKSGVAAFVAAAIDLVASALPAGSIAIAITGDEEGDGVDGTLAILDWMAQNGERIDHCLVGEADLGGDARRHDQDRPSRLAHRPPDRLRRPGPCGLPGAGQEPLAGAGKASTGSPRTASTPAPGHFGPSTLALTTVDTGNPASNVIPAEARATLNIRFNDRHSGASLSSWIEKEADRAASEFGVGIATRFQISGECFLTAPGPFTALVAAAIGEATGVSPEFSTTGGTSDARFVKDHCPVLEFGLVGTTMHQTDEHVEVAHIETLKAAYGRILERYFAERP